MSILLSSLLFPLLLIPPSVFTPAHRIEVEHFGHWVDISLYDSSFERVVGKYVLDHKLPPDWLTQFDGKVKVLQLTEYAVDSTPDNPDCTREVEWGAVRSSFPVETSGFTIVINPKFVGTADFDANIDAAFASMMDQVSAWKPEALLSESCIQ